MSDEEEEVKDAAGSRLLRGSVHGLTAEQRQSRRLNDALASMQSAGEILNWCQRRQPQFGAVHLVTALHRVAKSPDGAEVV